MSSNIQFDVNVDENDQGDSDIRLKIDKILNTKGDPVKKFKNNPPKRDLYKPNNQEDADSEAPQPNNLG